MSYRHRVVDTELRAALTSIGAVVIEGPRACGKTWTAEQVKGDAIRMDEPASRQLFQVAPRLVLQGAPPKLIDEWQVEPFLSRWSFAISVCMPNRTRAGSSTSGMSGATRSIPWSSFRMGAGPRSR